MRIQCRPEEVEVTVEDLGHGRRGIGLLLWKRILGVHGDLKRVRVSPFRALPALSPGTAPPAARFESHLSTPPVQAEWK